jgi:hypothetical protein
MRSIDVAALVSPLALGLLVLSLGGCASEETRDARGGGVGGGGLAAPGEGGAVAGAGSNTTGSGGDGGDVGPVLVGAAATSTASTGYGPDPEGACRSHIASSYAVDECLEAACCQEFNLCSDFGHDDGACASCLQAGGGLRCDDAVACIQRSGCMGALCPAGWSTCIGGSTGPLCIEAWRVCDDAPDCATGSDEATCD